MLDSRPPPALRFEPGAVATSVVRGLSVFIALGHGWTECLCGEIFFFHIVARTAGCVLLEYLREAKPSGVDPDRVNDDRNTSVDVLKYWSTEKAERIAPDQERRPTFFEKLSFYLLLVETRERNWESGMFLGVPPADPERMAEFAKEKARPGRSGRGGELTVMNMGER